MSIFNDDREQKFISVYRTYIDEIYQYVYLRTGLNQALAEDISQEIFLAVYKGLSGFKGLCSERTWVFRITKNKLNDFYRRQYSHKIELIEIDSQLAEQLDDPSQNIQEVFINKLEREKVRECLNGLLEHYKLVLILKYIDEKSIKEIAFLVGKSPKAIESILQRAKIAFIKSYMQCEEKEGL